MSTGTGSCYTYDTCLLGQAVVIPMTHVGQAGSRENTCNSTCLLGQAVEKIPMTQHVYWDKPSSFAQGCM